MCMCVRAYRYMRIFLYRKKCMSHDLKETENIFILDEKKK